MFAFKWDSQIWFTIFKLDLIFFPFSDSLMANIAVKINTNVEITFASIKTIFAMVLTIAAMVPTKIQNFVKVSHVTKFTNTNAIISNVSQDIMFAMVKIIVEMGLMKIT